MVMGFTGFYWVLLGFTGFYLVFLGFTGYYCVFMGFTGFLLGRIYDVDKSTLSSIFFVSWPRPVTRKWKFLDGFGGFDLVFLDFNGFY